MFRFQPLNASSLHPGGKWAALDVAQKASLSFSTLPAPMGDPQSWATWSKKSSGITGGMMMNDQMGIFVGEDFVVMSFFWVVKFHSLK